MAMPTIAEYGPQPGVCAPNPGTTRGSGTQLDISRDGKMISYGAGNLVVIRSLEDPSLALVYTEHRAVVNVARISPNGHWVASGDANGLVRVWSFSNPEHPLKKEVPCFAGPIRDLCWDPESKRIAAVGEGRGMMAKVFQFDTGSSLGEITGHTNRILSCSFKPTRPYRLVTASEDQSLCFFEGPPFRFAHSMKAHTNFVNCVRYSPNGERFISASSDKKMLLFDGRSGEQVGEMPLGDSHKGSIYNVAWSSDSKRLASVGADKTVRLWDMEALSLIWSRDMGKDRLDMQVGVAFAADTLITLSLSGVLNVLPIESPDEPVRLIGGMQQPIESIAMDGETLYSVGADGIALSMKDLLPVAAAAGKRPATRLVAIGVRPDDLVVAGWDDALHILPKADLTWGAAIKTPGQPCALAVNPVDPALTVFATNKAVGVFVGTDIGCTIEVPYTPTALDIKPDGSEIAVGCADNIVRFFKLEGGVLAEDGEAKPQRGAISCLKYSPDGAYIAVGDAYREVRLYSGREVAMEGRWVYHSTRITAVAWSPDSKHVASGSTDTHVMVFDVEQKIKHKEIKFVHMGGVSALTWKDEGHIYSAGLDSCVRLVTVPE
jgi:WD40 repeat protein